MPKKQLHLGYAMYNTGTNPAGWMINRQDISTDIAHFAHLARLAEAAKLDMVFRADASFARLSNMEAYSRHPAFMNVFEPIVLLAALSQVTSRIGLAATISTTFTEPYNIARQLASLDHMSHGRIAWNVVTSFSAQAARNYGHDDVPTHEQRYSRAQEYLDVIRALWDTYEDDAILHDTKTGRYFEPKKFHPVNFDGQYIKVHGALNISRPPQGYPVTIQAGASDEGRQFAAEIAEVIFASSVEKTKAQAFYAEMKGRAAAAGRGEDALKILPAITIMVGDSKAEAEARVTALDDMVPVEVKLQLLSEHLGVKLNDLPLDQPVPLEMIPEKHRGITHYFSGVASMIRDRMPLREMLRFYRQVSGGTVLCGSPGEVADHLESWVSDSACDGFVVIVPSAPSGFEEFCARVVPELQRRGSFRKEYSGTTLREHLGLPRPANQHLGRS